MPAVWTNNQIVSNLLRDGSSWSGQTVNYSFSTVAPAISFNAWYGEGNGAPHRAPAFGGAAGQRLP